MASESEYSIYLHNKMLSANAKKRKKADLNIQYAMKMVRTDVIEYGRESGTLTWRVLIVQAPHTSMDIKAKSRGRHYTVYGLSPLDNDDESGAYCKRWVVHADVDEEDAVDVSHFEKCKKNGRSYAAAHMKYLSGPFNLQSKKPSSLYHIHIMFILSSIASSMFLFLYYGR